MILTLNIGDVSHTYKVNKEPSEIVQSVYDACPLLFDETKGDHLVWEDTYFVFQSFHNFHSDPIDIFGKTAYSITTDNALGVFWAAAKSRIRDLEYSPVGEAFSFGQGLKVPF